jgi:hypothetical protein
MPGSRGRHAKGNIVQFRVPAEDLERWRAFLKMRHGYLSVLIRQAVDEHLDRHKDKKNPGAGAYWEWPLRSRGRY